MRWKSVIITARSIAWWDTPPWQTPPPCRHPHQTPPRRTPPGRHPPRQTLPLSDTTGRYASCWNAYLLNVHSVIFTLIPLWFKPGRIEIICPLLAKLFLCLLFRVVAQRVERQTEDPMVEGSSFHSQKYSEGRYERKLRSKRISNVGRYGYASMGSHHEFPDKYKRKTYKRLLTRLGNSFMNHNCCQWRIRRGLHPDTPWLNPLLFLIIIPSYHIYFQRP